MLEPAILGTVGDLTQTILFRFVIAHDARQGCDALHTTETNNHRRSWMKPSSNLQQRGVRFCIDKGYAGTITTNARYERTIGIASSDRTRVLAPGAVV